jgi:predicted transcriptional regulator YdeE
MKIVKYIFLLLVLASIATTVFIATQDGKYDIKKEKIINISKPALYSYLNDYKNWENLGIFTSADTTAAYSYSENTAGKGAFISWIKNGASGKITTVNSVASDSIRQKANVEDLDSDILWAFKDTLNSTKVTVRLKGKLTFKEKAYALFKGGVDNKIEGSLEKGLNNLNDFLVKELKVYNIEALGIVSKTGVFYLGHTVTGPFENASKNASAVFNRLTTFTSENKIVLTGAPFIIYKNIDKQKQTATYTYALPIRDEMFTAPGSDFEGGKLLPFNAFKTTLKGDHSHLPKAWQEARKTISEKALQENTTGLYVEIYTKTAGQTRRPSGFVTDLYIPIGAPQVATPSESTDPNAAITATISQTVAKATTTTAKPAANKPAASNSTSNTKPASTSGTTKPAVIKPAAAKPATTTTTTKPAATTAKTVTTSTAAPANKPAAATTTKTTTTKPAAKPASTSKPATTTTTVKPVVKPKSKPAETDDESINPPRA